MSLNVNCKNSTNDSSGVQHQSNPVAVGRWRLLRDALLLKTIDDDQKVQSEEKEEEKVMNRTTYPTKHYCNNNSTNDSESGKQNNVSSSSSHTSYSIHNFHGYNLLPPSTTINVRLPIHEEQNQKVHNLSTKQIYKNKQLNYEQMYHDLTKIRLNVPLLRQHSTQKEHDELSPEQRQCDTSTTTATNESYSNTLLKNQLLEQLVVSILALSALISTDASVDTPLVINISFEITASIIIQSSYSSNDSNNNNDVDVDDMNGMLLDYEANKDFTRVVKQMVLNIIHGCFVPRNGTFGFDGAHVPEGIVTTNTHRYCASWEEDKNQQNDKRNAMWMLESKTNHDNYGSSTQFVDELKRRCLPEVYVNTAKLEDFYYQDDDQCIHNIKGHDNQYDKNSQLQCLTSLSKTASATTFQLVGIPLHICFITSEHVHDDYSIQQYSFRNDNLKTNNCQDNNQTVFVPWYTREKRKKKQTQKWNKYLNPQQGKLQNRQLRSRRLKELTSHRYNNSIDNTGNVCVWDCEKTITWALLSSLSLHTSFAVQGQENNEKSGESWYKETCLQLSASFAEYSDGAKVTPVVSLVVPSSPAEEVAAASSADGSGTTTILELGAGMAGLVGLSLCCNIHVLNLAKDLFWSHNVDKKVSTNMTKTINKVRIVLTDGHPDCVRNNEVNVRLCQAACDANGITNPKHGNTQNKDEEATIECDLLKWDIPDHCCKDSCLESSKYGGASLTIASDCIHFEEYHAALIWTMMVHTAVCGYVYLCQPNRGQSLDRFLFLVETLNNNLWTCNDFSNIPNQLQQQDKQSHLSDDGEYTNPCVASVNNSYTGVKSSIQPSLRAPLLTVTEREYSEIEKNHLHYIRTNQEYNPNIHKPRILIMQKLRKLTYDDHQLLLNHHRKSNT